MEFELEIPKKQFQIHLEIPKNQRIIFSGAFGTGKTYFLDKFFKNHEKYEAIHIYPVNYSVTSNEDIFELIKYDVLFKLLEKGLNFDEVKIDKGTFLPFFLENHSNKLIPHLLSKIPEVGGSLEKLAKGFLALHGKFQKEFRQINETDNDKVLTYLKKFTEQPSSIHEEDFFTQLICGLVEQLKKLEPLGSEVEKNAKKETEKKEAVLIIDDLDRIDPEHIFRIMNVLAAHVDINKDQNKFDFDKIILVCDIENIRKIFSNRYGVDVDFSGYIDKFYSRSVFHYDLSGEMIKKIDQVFHNISVSDGKIENKLGDFRNNRAAIMIKFILLACLKYNLFPVRNLNRIISGSNALAAREFWNPTDYKSLDSEEIEMVKVIDFLLFVFQGYQNLVNKCEFLIGRDLKNSMTSSKNIMIEEWLKAACFKEYFLIVERRTLREITERDIEINGMKIKFSISNTGLRQDQRKEFYDFRIQSINMSGKENISVDSLDFFELLTWLLKESDFRQLFNVRV